MTATYNKTILYIISGRIKIPKLVYPYLFYCKRKEGVSKCTHPLFMHKAPTFSSQGFAIS